MRSFVGEHCAIAQRQVHEANSFAARSCLVLPHYQSGGWIVIEMRAIGRLVATL